MIETTAPARRRRRTLALLLIPATLSAITVFLLWQAHPEIDYWLELMEDGRSYLESHPWALVLALATLPGIGFPISPLLALFGVVLAPRFGMPVTLGLAFAAQSLCTTWTFLLASGPLREFLHKRILARRNLPKMTEVNTIRLGLVLRLTPGIPYALQNIVLGIMGMRLIHYLTVSIPTTSLWTLGFVMTGGAIFKGEIGWALAGVLIIIVLILITRMWGRKNKAEDG